MQLLGHVKNGKIVLDNPQALPEGAKVKVSVQTISPGKLAGSVSKYAKNKPFPTKDQIEKCLMEGLGRGRKSR